MGFSWASVSLAGEIHPSRAGVVTLPYFCGDVLSRSLRRCASRRVSGAAPRSGLPPVAGPGLTDETTGRDDGAGESEVELDHGPVALAAADELAVVVHPRVGALMRMHRVATGDWVGIGLRPCPEGCLRLWWTGGRVAVIEPVSRCPATIVYRGTMQPAEGSGEEEGMEAIFWFVFGAVAGMAALPHLQRMAARVRRTLAELDQPKHPSSRS